MPGWVPPPKRFPHDPAFDKSGPGWHLPEGQAVDLPRDYEGRHGAGFAVSMAPKRSFRTVEKMFNGCGWYAVGLAAVLLIVAITDAAEIRVDEAVGIGMFVAILLALGAILGLWIPSLMSGWQNRRPPRLGLLVSVSGMTIVEKKRSMHVPWIAIGQSRLHWTSVVRLDEDALPLTNWLAFEADPSVMPDGADEVKLDVATFRADPRVVVELIEFYRDHPEERAELNSVVWEDRARSIAQELARQEA